MKRKIILTLTMSLDGVIADDKAIYDWIEDDGKSKLDTVRKLNFNDLLKHVDTIVMGRKSVKSYPVDLFKSQKIIITTSAPMTKFDNLEFVNTNIGTYVETLSKVAGKDIWLFGGSILIDAFIKGDTVDEFIIEVVPIILGNGIRLLKENNPMITLQVEDYTIKEELPIMRYTKRQ